MNRHRTWIDLQNELNSLSGLMVEIKDLVPGMVRRYLEKCTARDARRVLNSVTRLARRDRRLQSKGDPLRDVPTSNLVEAMAQVATLAIERSEDFYRLSREAIDAETRRRARR
jgi:hypothetical protein